MSISQPQVYWRFNGDYTEETGTLPPATVSAGSPVFVPSVPDLGQASYVTGAPSWLNGNGSVDLAGNDFTIAAWVNRTTPLWDPSIICGIWSAPAPRPFMFGFQEFAGTTRLKLWYNSGDGPYSTAAVLSAAATWYHVVVKRQSNQIRFYINGVYSPPDPLGPSGDFTGVVISPPAGKNIALRAGNTEGALPINECYIDELAIWYEAVSDADIISMSASAPYDRYWPEPVSPPSWEATYPKAGTVGKTTAQILGKTDNDSDMYAVAVGNGDAAPSAAQIKAGEDSTGTPVAAGLAQSVSLSAGIEDSVTLTGLDDDTAYDVYLVAANAGGDTTVEKVDILTLPSIPDWETGYPVAGSIDSDSAIVTGKTDINSTMYAVVLSSGASAPSSAQVKAGTDAGGVLLPAGRSGSVSLSAGVEGSIPVFNLIHSTAYDMYVVAENAIQPNPVLVSFTTSGYGTPITLRPSVRVSRTFLARNVLGPKQIIPPADVTLLESDWLTQLVEFGPQTLDDQSNLLVRRVGLFSNFADGLVFKNPYERFHIQLTAYSASIGAKLSGKGNTPSLSTKALTGDASTIFTGEVSPGDVLLLVRNSDSRAQYVTVDSVTDNSNIILRDFPLFVESSDNLLMFKMQLTAGASSTIVRHVNNLNQMYDLDWFARPAFISSASDVLIKASVNQDIPTCCDGHDHELATVSMSTDFANYSMWVDVVLDCDVTLSNIRQ